MTTHKTYLSIDADWFNNHNVIDAQECLEKVINKAKYLKIPVHCVTNHQQLIPRVDGVFSNGNCTLINIDWHSDICNVNDLDELNCGSWCSFVKYRCKNNFLWLHPKNTFAKPYSIKYGNCNGDDKWNYGTDWGSVNRKSIGISKITELVSKDVAEIGLCLSPCYTDFGIQYMFKKLLKKHGLKKVRGVAREDLYKVNKFPSRGY